VAGLIAALSGLVTAVAALLRARRNTRRLDDLDGNGR
jgi:hypothetical protein